MRTFEQMKAWTRPVLDRNNFRNTSIDPGPELPDTPDDSVIWTRYGGPGEDADGALDEISWQARCIGKQNDYNSAESLADAIDLNMISHFSSKVGDLWVSQIRRAGGAPASLLTDNAERTHFVCSYVVSVELALPIR